MGARPDLGAITDWHGLTVEWLHVPLRSSKQFLLTLFDKDRLLDLFYGWYVESHIVTSLDVTKVVNGILRWQLIVRWLIRVLS